MNSTKSEQSDCHGEEAAKTQEESKEGRGFCSQERLGHGAIHLGPNHCCQASTSPAD